MARTGPGGPSLDPSRPGRRGSIPNEDGLRALGDVIDGRGGRARAGTRAGTRAGPAADSRTGAGAGGRYAGRSNGGRPVYDEARPSPRGRQAGSSSRTQRRRARTQSRRRRRTKRAVLVSGLVVLLLILAGGGYAYYLNSEIHRVDVRGLTVAPTSGADAGTENILMVGSTTRCGLAHQNAAYGLCSQGVTGVNSDVIMILHLNPATRSVSILSLPRDLFIPNARARNLKQGITAANKIDAGLYDGPSQLVASIQEDFGIPIQHYVVLNFDTFASVVNALGGINMYFPMPVFDAYSQLYVPTPGCIHLDGYRALQVVRARHLQYRPAGVTANRKYWPHEVQSDLARIRRDHEFLRVLATAVSKKGLGNPITDEQMVSSVAPYLTVDSSFSTTDMIHLVLTFHSVNAAKAPQYTLPVEPSSSLTYAYKSGDYGNVEFPATAPDQRILDQFLGVSATTNTLTGRALPSPSSVTVSVLNGTGIYNQAANTANALSALGFHIAGIGNATPTGPISETLVAYGQKTPAVEAAAQAVMRSLSGAAIMDYNPSLVADGAQVTVVTGSQFSVNPPPSSSTGSAAGSSSTASSAPVTSAPTSTGSGTSSSSASLPPTFSSPTPAVTPLKPWDPRSCTASGGEGP